MANGFDTTLGIPSEREGWWGKVTSALQEDPLLPKETDYGQVGSILGRGAQVFSARDPQSWQYQLGGLGAEIGQAHKMAEIAEADKKRRDEFRKLILKSLGLDVPMPGEVKEEPTKEPRMSLGELEGTKSQAILNLMDWR